MLLTTLLSSFRKPTIPWLGIGMSTVQPPEFTLTVSPAVL